MSHASSSIHIISYYKLFLYFNLCLMLDSLACSCTSNPFVLQAVPLLYLCLMLDSLACSSTSISFLTQAVPLLQFVSNVG